MAASASASAASNVAWPREVEAAAVQASCLEVDGGLHGAATAAGVANPAHVGALPLGGAVMAALLTIDGWLPSCLPDSGWGCQVIKHL